MIVFRRAGGFAASISWQAMAERTAKRTEHRSPSVEWRPEFDFGHYAT
jgi:hypothetical protein